MLIFVAISIILLLSINIFIVKTTESLIFKNIEEAPPKQIALLLGARVYSDGSLSDILKDRALTTIELYKNGKVQKILVSGDHGKEKYDEVNTIKDFLLENGVPAEDIFLDHAGFDTYDSLYRAKSIFQVSSAIIVTQNFHLPRSVYIGKSLGLDVAGVSADRQLYINANYNEARESFARFKAFIDVTFQSKPKFLGSPIPITGDSTLSWDKV